MTTIQKTNAFELLIFNPRSPTGIFSQVVSPATPGPLLEYGADDRERKEYEYCKLEMTTDGRITSIYVATSRHAPVSLTTNGEGITFFGSVFAIGDNERWKKIKTDRLQMAEFLEEMLLVTECGDDVATSVNPSTVRLTDADMMVAV